MSVHVLLNLLNKLRKRDKIRGLPNILTLFRNEFNNINNTRARMLDSIYIIWNLDYFDISFHNFVIMYATLFWKSYRF